MKSLDSLCAVVVNHDAGSLLAECVTSLRREGVDEVVVVDNGSTDCSLELLASLDNPPDVIRCSMNIGFGSGANRGIAATSASLVMVCNPDIVLHPGAAEALVAALAADPHLGIAGPQVLDGEGHRYPSARSFPSLTDAAGHALLGLLLPGNRFTSRYHLEHGGSQVLDAPEQGPSRSVQVDWVSGSCFVARRALLDELGGFDESYFMYAEDVDLCWRAWRAGWAVAYVPVAVVTHEQGVSTARHPYRMLLEHHRSLMRFANRTVEGTRRALLPLVAAGIAARMVIAASHLAMTRLRSRSTASLDHTGFASTLRAPVPPRRRGQARVSVRSWLGSRQESGWRVRRPPEAGGPTAAKPR